MADTTLALPARALLTEAAWKTILCGGAAAVIALLLPYSSNFALQTVTHLGFAVALAEGVLSMFADVFDAPHYALKKIVEGVETLIASSILATATLVLHWMA